MPQRYVCLICRNEIPNPSAECPYCKSRSMIAEGASVRVLIIVFSVMTALFIVTGIYTKSFKEEKSARGELHYKFAQNLMTEQDYKSAVGRYRDALLYSPDSLRYRLGLAEALFALGLYPETENHLLEIRATDPTSGIVNHMLGRLAAQADRTDEAISFYRTAIYGQWANQADQMRVGVRYDLIDLLEKTNRKQQLTVELLDLIEIVPNDRALKFQLAGLLLTTGVYDQSNTIFRELLANSPKDRLVILGIAECEFNLTNYLTARTYFSRAQLIKQDEATKGLITLCNRILELDPTRRRIALSERYRRSRSLVDRTRIAVENCLNPVGEDFVGPLSPVQPELNAVLKLAQDLQSRRRRQSVSEDSIEANIQLAEDIWNEGISLCSGIETVDEPLKRVMAKLSQ